MLRPFVSGSLFIIAKISSKAMTNKWAEIRSSLKYDGVPLMTQDS